MISNIKTRLNSIFKSWKKTLAVATCVTVIGGAVTIVNMKKTISVVIDGQEVQITTLASDLGKILDKQQIKVESFDKVSVALDSKVKDGDKIYIKKAVDVEVNVDGKVLKFKSSEDNVGNMLDSKKIAINDLDKISPTKDELLQDGMKINVTRVAKEVKNEVKSLEYAVEKRENNDLAEGTENIVQEGQNGEKLITSEVVYENGKEVSRKVVGEKVQKNPVNKIVDVGTLATVRTSRGAEENYTDMVVMESTAYTADRGNDNGITASGTSCVRDPNGYSTIAVDPRVIPLGTKVYIEGYGYAIAQDTGGAIKGNIIDVYFNSYSETMNWGRRNVKVYILK
ncbi:3D domain-containing protein [Clostridium senegalense]|uniref:3D domain-containing protein n=1 Tax=Clostridium senegalense TaxID=1465809 RepID=UPI00028956E2|nr:3D domain-containing protein [Clostridium senegalense]